MNSPETLTTLNTQDTGRRQSNIINVRENQRTIKNEQTEDTDNNEIHKTVVSVFGLFILDCSLVFSNVYLFTLSSSCVLCISVLSVSSDCSFLIVLWFSLTFIKLLCLRPVSCVFSVVSVSGLFKNKRERKPKNNQE
jgi:hypothetical protein